VCLVHTYHWLLPHPEAVSHAYVRRVAAAELSVDAAALRFDWSGKPVCRSHPAWHFSLSHSGPHLVIATHDSPIGIDIEVIRPFDTRVIRRLSPAEQAAHARGTSFFELWTKREAAFKSASPTPHFTPITISPDTCCYLCT
jgi:phosphopantetheinyl transferase